MSYPEFIQWIHHFRMKSDAGQPTAPGRQQTWEDQFSVMQGFPDAQNAKR
jgi:hypothetical protein